MCPTCFLQTDWPLSVRQCTVHTKYFSRRSSLRVLVGPYCVPTCSSIDNLTPRPHLQHTLTLPLPVHLHSLCCPLLIHTVSQPNQSHWSSNSNRVHSPFHSNGLLTLCPVVYCSQHMFPSSVIKQGSRRSLKSPTVFIYGHNDTLGTPPTHSYASIASSFTAPVQYSLKSHCPSH